MSKRYLWLTVALVVAGCSEAYEPVDAPGPDLEVEDPWLFKDVSVQVKAILGEELTIQADFGPTRTHIEMNEAGTYAASVWDAGDSFKMYGYDSSNGWHAASFSTTEGGESVSFSTGNSLPNPAPYYAVYPSADKIGQSSSDRKLLLGVNLPAHQTVVAGGFTRGLALAYTSAQSLTESLHFQSQVSLVRFRMSGSIVGNVQNVTLKGAGTLAGDAIIVLESDGTGTLTQSRMFQGDVQSSTVTLSGSFVAGQDYYMVLYPGTQSGFQMIFDDGNGSSTTKVASRFTFPRSRISDFGTIDLGDSFTDGETDFSPVQYMAATAGAPKPVTMAVIPDGFTEAQMQDYEMLARSGIDALMNTEPFKSYKEYFNVWILKVASNESGANITDGNGNIVTRRDCYFGSKWGVDKYTDMIADENKVYDFVTNNCPDIKDGIHTIDEVPVLMIINDDRYGGICRYYSSGRGYCMAPYTKSGGSLGWAYASKGVEAASATAEPENVRSVTDEERQELGINTGNWLNTLVHEFGGHCFSRLKDEYWYLDYDGATTSIASHSWTVPYGLNISATYNNPGWKADLLGDDLNVLPSLVQKDARYGRIGIFQGGDVSLFNRWRSEKVSCMIDNRFYFSAWQRILIVKRIMTLSGSEFDIDSFWDKDDPIDPVRDSGSSLTYGSSPLRVQTMPMLPPPVLMD